MDQSVSCIDEFIYINAKTCIHLLYPHFYSPFNNRLGISFRLCYIDSHTLKIGIITRQCEVK